MDKRSHTARPADSGAAIQFPAVTATVRELPNGLGIIVQEDHSAPVASVQVWIDTGSIHEGKHLGGGMSHMLEHMLFKGTARRGSSEFAQSIQDVGGYINAYTSFDRTVYWIDIPSKGVNIALDLLSDAVMNSTLPSDEYVKEQEVIRREFAMGNDDPDRVSFNTLFSTAFRSHPYRHPIIGHLDVFNEIGRDEVMAFYKARYVPNNMFFVVVGDVDAGEVHAQLSKHFAGCPRRSLAPVFIPPEPPQLGSRERHIEFPTELTRLHLAWPVPAAWHPDIPALDVAAVVLGAGRSSRLYKKLREELALVHSVDAWCYAPGQAGLFGVDAMLDPDNRAAVQAETLRIIDELRSGGVTGRELEKARKMALSHQLQSVTTMRGRASDLGSNWLLTGNLDFSRDYLESIQKVTAEDIRRVLTTYVVSNRLNSVSLNPQGSLGRDGALRSTIKAGDIQKFELSNGLRLLVREDPRLPLVTMNAVFKGGLLTETPLKSGISRLFSKVILKGTQLRSAEQIADGIEELGGGIGSESGNNSVSVSARVMSPDLRAGLEILSDVIRNATFPARAVEREKEAQLASIKAEDEDMSSVGRRLLRAGMFGAHPYGLRSSGTPESVTALTSEDLLDFRDRYLVARNGVLAVFGDVRAEEVRTLAEELFGGMSAGEAALAEVPLPATLTGPLEIEELKEKEQAILMVGFPGIDMFHPDSAALELIDEACSDLGSRLFLRIREEMGLAYFVGSSHMTGLAPGMFSFYLGTAPEKLEEVKAALSEEIEKLAQEGLTPEEVARAKEKNIGQQDIRNQSNPALAYQSALNELYGLGHSYHLAQRKEIEAMTVEKLLQVSNEHFRKPSVTVVVRPAPSAA